MDLYTKIQNRQARVGVVGLGYVGLPLAVEFARSGFHVTGFDLSHERVDAVNAGVTYLGDVAEHTMRELVLSKRLKATMDFEEFADMDTVSICVPTPLRKTRDPDLTYIVSAIDELRPRLHRDQLIVLESTTYPGTTEELVRPKLEESGLVAGKDFFLAFSPERVDPGNKTYTTRNIPKVVGGVTPRCTELAAMLYAQCVDRVQRVSSARVAEMVKLLENTFRSVNIGLANEMALLCHSIGIDVWEVIEAAATKPFGFLPFYPGPGLGGHCIPIDPHYLSWKLRTLDYQARFIELAAEINGQMPHYVLSKVVDALNDQRKAVAGSRLLVIGVAYKRDTSDIRESPSLDVIKLLRERGAKVDYHDPHVPRLGAGMAGPGPAASSIKLTPQTLKRYDCTVIVTDHKGIDYQKIVDGSKVVVDTRNATRGVRRGRGKVIKL